MSTLRPSRRPALPVVGVQLAGRPVVAGLLAVVLPLALTACGASRDPQTYQERSQADATNTAVGALAVRGLAVVPPEDDDRVYEAGSDAEVTVVVTSNDDEADVLEDVSSPAAQSVEVLVDGEPSTLRVPPLGSTGSSVRLRLVGLTEDVREGEFVTMTLRFRDNGSVEVEVPVAVSGRTDRPVYTGTEGEEPALQAPAGGHHGEEGEGEGEGGESGTGEVEETDDGEPDEGDLAEAEVGQDTDEEAPREDQANEPSESATDESEAPSR